MAHISVATKFKVGEVNIKDSRVKDAGSFGNWQQKGKNKGGKEGTTTDLKGDLEADKDHQKIGREQELFFLHELSPGCGFFLPKGTFIYNKLMDFMKSEYRKRGYQEVISPNLLNTKLFEISGHNRQHSKNTFSFESEKENMSMKPMNCPCHCLLFDHRSRSWRELPYRIVEFGKLHRNELLGTLSGLNRMRRFVQDDAHIFCPEELIQQEITGVLDFMKAVYNVFGFTYKLELSTRPKKYQGDIELWDNAEKQLRNSLIEFGEPWKVNPGDAFGNNYGPKIDITIEDALRRSHQCGTIQLDFELPIRFNLKYQSADGTEKKPVIIHRAILGSVDRLMAVLTETHAGKWPFWISPRQAIVIPEDPKFNDYCMEVKKRLFEAGFNCDCNINDGESMDKKMSNATLAQYNFMLVVGEKDGEHRVKVHTRDNHVHGEHTIDAVIERFQYLDTTKLLKSEEAF